MLSMEKSKSTFLLLCLFPINFSSQTTEPFSSSMETLKGVPGLSSSLMMMDPRRRSSLRTFAGCSTISTARSGGESSLPRPMVWMGMSREARSLAASKGDAPELWKPSDRITAAEGGFCPSFWLFPVRFLVTAWTEEAKSVLRVSGQSPKSFGGED